MSDLVRVQRAASPVCRVAVLSGTGFEWLVLAKKDDGYIAATVRTSPTREDTRDYDVGTIRELAQSMLELCDSVEIS